MSIQCQAVEVIGQPAAVETGTECYRGIKIYYPNSPAIPTIPEWEGQINYRDYYLSRVDTSGNQNPFKWIASGSLQQVKDGINARMASSELGGQC